MILDLAAAEPDALALTDDFGASRTRGELVDRATRLGHVLRDDLDLREGAHIAVLTDNRVEVFEIYLAAVLSGVWFVPVNGLLAPHEVGYVLRDAEACVVLAESELAHLVPAEIPVIELGPDLDRLIEGAADTPFPLDATPGSRFSYTSGTTGHPKGVKRAVPSTVSEMLALQQQLGNQVGFDGDGTQLVTGPAYHAAVGGYGFFDLCNGAHLHLMRKFDAERTLRLIGEMDVRRTHLVPTMMVRLLRLPEEVRGEFDPSPLRMVLHGAAPISRSVKQQMIDWFGPILTEYWGTSEAGVFTRVDADEWLVNPGTVGRSVTGFEVFSVDDHGNRLPAGEVGTLYCRTPGSDRPFDYWNAPEKTDAAYLAPGVFSLGDMGSVDAEGWVYLADRATNMIISGGVNIYPTEVEQALLDHPSVVDVAVFGIPDHEWGEQVKAAVEFAADASPDVVDALLEFARERLGRHKVPRSIDVHASLPRQPNGKLYTRQLRDPYWQGHERAI
ncbi:MAG: AMP-binding protein [Acidimicrobiales bacterium]|jgi:long-chain acyl-CoA synthetase|nr:AMP-binding protein [Acidimicrobiales bacterium]